MGNETVLTVVITSLVAVGIAIYQVKSAKNTKSNGSKKVIWESLQSLKVYYELGMSEELSKNGSLTLKPILDFRETVSKNQHSLNIGLYQKLESFYELLSSETEKRVLLPMREYLNKKDDHFPPELEKIQLEVNENRTIILKIINNFINENRNEL